MHEHAHREDKVTPVAVTNWRDIRKKFGIKEKNRRGHMYVVGKTGTGKSSLLGNMLISDLSQGNGVARTAIWRRPCFGSSRRTASET
jgi:GTPase